MAEVEREAALLAQAGPAADRPAAPRERRRFRFPALTGWRLAPVAAGLLIVGVLAGVVITGAGDSTRVVPAGQSAEVHVDGDKATLVAQNMAQPPEGRVYEVWVVPKGGPRDAAQPTDVLFVPRADGSAEAAIPGDASEIQRVMVSDEPPGGSDTPTGNVVADATLS
jgi:hypothetical protein